MGDMCRTYLVVWIHTSLTSLVRTQLKRPTNPLHIGYGMVFSDEHDLYIHHQL